MSVQSIEDDGVTYKVVVNHEEQYSIWPLTKPNPLGWVDGGKSGYKQECLAFIKEVWTDMRPLSLRKAQGERITSKRSGGPHGADSAELTDDRITDSKAQL